MLVSKDKLLAYTITGGVVSEEPLASMAGARILEKEGNAVDAAVATSLALAVVTPHLGGIGGDFFALVRTPEGEVYFVNGSGYAPSRLTRELVREKGYTSMPSRGPLSITVPGMVDALYTLWRRWGSLEWATLVEPAEALARNGFPAPPSLVKAIKSNLEVISRDPGSKQTYLELGIEEPGDPVVFPGLAELLGMVKEDPRSFYEGEPAERIEEYVSSLGGVLSKGDMKLYHASEDTPLSIEYHGWRVYEMPPNTQGITTLHMLMLLEDKKLPKNTLLRLRHLLQAAKKAYAVRDKYIGDPRFMRLKSKELLSKEVLENISWEPQPMGGGEDTTFFAVVDREGVIVAGIQSLFYPFGSAITEPKYQVTLNNRAQGFTLKEGYPNTLAPLKKPLHTLSAVIMENSSHVIALGLSGGHLRPQLHALLITSIIDHGMDVGEAISAPRAVWQPGSNRIIVDKGFADKITPPEGYELVEGRTGVASAIDVRLDKGTRVLATDPRGDGYPLPLI
ncbi:MAG: gamma-glutamyltransferase family protein [Pyrodictiaceae archaeon]